MMTTVHGRTPSLVVNDSRGLPLRQVAYLRTEVGGTADALITRQLHDVRGRLIGQWDPRLFGVAPTPNLATVYRLSGETVRVDSVDAGWRLNLSGMSGEVLQRWDPRGTHWHTTYDNQLRVIALQENAQPNVERFTYANATAAASHNLRGKLIGQVDPSGTVSFDSYSLGGEALGDSRTFVDGAPYTSRRTVSPLGAVLDQTDAKAHQQQFGYDLAGQLKRVELKIDPTASAQAVLADAHYNAAGQLIEQHASNGVVSRWTYDPADGRLTRQQAGLPGQPVLQNLGYTYDRVGNVLAIDDLAFTPVFFANQRVDGRREFSYDSLYQLRSATGFETDTPNLRPGLPTPITPVDTGRLYNYAQQYEYDTGGNLTTLRHVRTGNNHTQTTRIAPDSNRGVRWAEGDPAPIFDEHFDPHGNLLLLEKGQPLTWNRRDQLAVARLVERSGGPNDEETYVYSQGQRVSKRLLTQAQSVSHVRQVLYLPGLEIRTLDDAEELHVITLGNVRCLHWVKGKPAAIEQNQLRYSLDDHLGSSTLELDRNGALISQEIYYPFGGTAWWAARSAVEVDYKTIRYSGKEMDVSGLYYYGARYYAPWLQRWVSADPGGDVDGLNLYAMVGNNPLNYFDGNGESKTRSQLKSEIVGGFQFLSSVHHEMKTLTRQLDDLSYPASFRLNILKNVVYQIGSIPVGWFTSFHAAGAVGSEGFPGFSEAFPHSSGAVFGIGLGNAVADSSTGLYATIMSPLKLNTPVVPDPSHFSNDTLRERAGIAPPNTDNPWLRPPTGDEMVSGSITLVSKTVGAYIPGVGEAFELAKVAEAGTSAEEGLLAYDLNEITSTLDQLRAATIDVAAEINANFTALGITEFYDKRSHGWDFLVDLGLGRVGTAKARTVRQARVEPFKERALDDIAVSKLTAQRYGAHVARKSQKRAA